MKKNYFMLAAATMMFAACAETDLVNEINEATAQQAIGFETFANKTTRAVKDEVADGQVITSNTTKFESYHTSFGVWAYKTVGTTESAVMKNYKVEASNSIYTYDGKTGGEDGREVQSTKYWDKNASYAFYAYAPYSSTVTISEKEVTEGEGDAAITKTIKVISIPQGEYAANENLQSDLVKETVKEIVDGEEKDVEKDVEKGFTTTLNTKAFTTSTDWMIATPENVAKGTTSTVQEKFAHTMSKVIVTLQSTVANVEVTSVSISNVYGTGAYTSNGGWSISNAQATTINGLTGTLATKDTKYYTMEYLLIPAGAAPKFNITYEINGDEYTVTDAAITSISTIAANTCYTINVTIGLTDIEFSATASDFEDSVTGAVDIQ